MKKSFFRFILLASVATFGLSTHAIAESTLPDAGCSLSMLQGGYTWYESTRTPRSYYNPDDTSGEYVFAVSVGREVNDGNGNITAGSMNVHNTFFGSVGADTPTDNYTGTITLEPNCIGTYSITMESGANGGGGKIYVDPVSGNFTMLDEFNIGIAYFRRDGSDGGLKNPFPTISWP